MSDEYEQFIPKYLREKYPEIVQVHQALDAYIAGKPATINCPKCDQLLVVTDMPPVDNGMGIRIVGCGTPNCTHVRFRYTNE